jgi:F-type H+-transporting ATPase subunit gamma
MPKLDTIKNDMSTVEDLSTLTRVLEETAARDIAQMRKRIIESRPYFQEAWKIFNVLQKVAPQAPDVLNKHLVIAITLDWGMTGSLLNRVVDKAEELYDRYEADLMLTGKMGRQRFANRDERTIHLFNVPKKAAYNDIEPLYAIVAKYAQVHFVYPRFESIGKQVVSVASMSVRDNDKKKKMREEGDPIEASRFVIEPNIPDVVNYMNKVIVGLVVYNYFSEALLAYSAAQMVAMRSANDNTKDARRRLLIRYNKARRELVDSKLREQYESSFGVGSKK